MKHCQNCNKPNEDDAIFCLNCGYRFQNSSEINLPKLENSPTNISKKSLGIKFITLYEAIISILFIYFGSNLVTIKSIYTSILGFLENNSNSPSTIQIVGIVLIVWGILGIIGGISLIAKKKMGYYLTCFFMVSQGLLFAWLILPLLIMVYTFVYFDTNDSFIYNFRNQHDDKSKKLHFLDSFLDIF